MSLFATSLLISAAWAHRPHAVILAQAIAPDYPTSGEAWIVYDPNRQAHLLYTDSHGQYFDFVGGAPTDDILVDAAWTDEALVLLGDTGRVWISTDRGGSWEGHWVASGAVSAALAVAGTRFFVATDAGLSMGALASPASAVIHDPTGNYLAVAAAGTSVLAARDDGTVWRSGDAGQSFPSSVAVPAERTATALATDGTDDFLGTDGGAYRREGGAWVACGALAKPDDGVQYETYVAHMALSAEGDLLVATGAQALYRSSDGCQTWDLEASPLDVEYGGVGNARGPEDSFRGLSAAGDYRMVGGFSGVAVSSDAGETWRTPTIVTYDYYRGVSLTADGAMYFTTYGGGVTWTADGGETWRGSAVGMTSAVPYDVAADGNFASNAIVYAVDLDVSYRSLDGGETWEAMSIPMPRARILASFPDRTYALGENADGGISGRLAVSADQGETWTAIPAFQAAAGSSAPRGMTRAQVAGRDLLLVSVDQPSGALLSDDAGQSWSWVRLDEGLELGAGAVAVDADGALRLVYASASDGTLLSDDEGGAWREPTSPPDGVPALLVAADDHTLFLATRSAELWRSRDAGETWTQVHAGLPQAVQNIDTSDDFAQTGTIVVGTTHGAYTSADGGDTWQLLARFERVEVEDEVLASSCRTGDGLDCLPYADAANGLGGGLLLGDGASITTTFQGHALRILGPRPGDAAIQVTIDGALSDVTPEGRVDITGLAEGWHELEIRVDSPNGSAHIDALEWWGEGASSGEIGDSGDTAEGDSASADDTGRPPLVPRLRCGCGSGSAPAALLPLALLLVRRRRR